MTGPRLTEHQQEALRRYAELQEQYPDALFRDRPGRRLVLDSSRLRAFCADQGVVLGLTAETPHILVVVDLVEIEDPREGRREFPYVRVVHRRQLQGARNVVVIATVEDEALGPLGAVVMLNQERHATGRVHLELPRGFGEQGLSGEENALKELHEETGFLGDRAEHLGSTYTDTGLTDALVSFYVVPVTAAEQRRPDPAEALLAVELVPLAQLWGFVRDGTVQDAFTLQALALLDAWTPVRESPAWG